MKQQPIKRSEYIIALSRDHHTSLLFCWKIKEGLKKNVPGDNILRYINFFWTQHLKEHFKEEEALLFSRADDTLSRRGKSEHLMLERRINYLKDNKDDAQAYLEFTDMLIKHIRFEERELFPHLEAKLPEATLKQVGEYLIAQHSIPKADDYRDEFWSKNYSPNERPEQCG
ncbi:MAG TPA: hemerythrin domain-containing protein [Mucilaginibacter sp.]|nr:hemerythrin domain-containing protein [Mucilaginibacter sp.]